MSNAAIVAGLFRSGMALIPALAALLGAWTWWQERRR